MVVPSFLRHITRNLALQLCAHHLKSNQVLLLLWLGLFAIVKDSWGGIAGIHYLFLDPEYMGHNGFVAFGIVGLALGVFITSFNTSTYIMDGHKFYFLGLSPHPFARFSLNNILIPIAFLITYVVCIVQFQHAVELVEYPKIAWKVAGLLLGTTLSISLTLLYDYWAERQFTLRVPQSELEVLPSRFTQGQSAFTDTETFLYYPWKIEKVHPYPVFRRIMDARRWLYRSYVSLFSFEVFVIALFISLSLLGNHYISHIPAAASVLMFLSTLMILSGCIALLSKQWRSTLTIVLWMCLNAGVQKGWLWSKRAQAYGLNYKNQPTPYTEERIQAVNTAQAHQQDKQHTLQILQRWRAQFPANKPPKLCILCASGGGQAASLWTFKALQDLHQHTQGKLMQHTTFTSSISGGGLGASYFRELYLQQRQGRKLCLTHPIYLERIAVNQLNPIVLSMFFNDMLLDINTFRYEGQIYRKDRSYAIEKQFNESSKYVLQKPLVAYREPEQKALIPMMIFSPVIANDGRRVFISPHRVSYMGQAFSQNSTADAARGVDFMRFFKDHNPERLNFLSAVRINAAFPYVLPSITLPTAPSIDVIDAGFADAFGMMDAAHFLYTFKDWIEKNTSGVAIVAIRYNSQNATVQASGETLMQKITRPLSGVLGIIEYLQITRNEDVCSLLESSFTKGIQVINFDYCNEYDPQQYAAFEKPSLRFHLTTKEKQSIVQAMYTPENQQALHKLKEFLQ